MFILLALNDTFKQTNQALGQRRSQKGLGEEGVFAKLLLDATESHKLVFEIMLTLGVVAFHCACV